jgi:hypothetical protein
MISAMAGVTLVIACPLISSAVANFRFPQAAPMLVDVAAGRVTSGQGKSAPYMAADLTDFAAFQVLRLKAHKVRFRESDGGKRMTSMGRERTLALEPES